MEMGTSNQGKEERQMGRAVWHERGMKNKIAKSMLRSAHGECEEYKLAEECQKGGGVGSV
jgi:hypothetical protein